MPCPICNSNQVNTSYAVKGGVCLDQCLTCGHAFQGVPQEEQCNRDMQLKYFGEAFAERHGFFFDLYENINARRTLRALHGRRNQNVLEIGPGSGRTMSCLASAGHQVQGLDLSPAVAQNIAATWGLSVHVASLDAHARSVGSQYYDVIIMRHVLEHFSNPCEALGTMHTLLKAHGVLYIAVPNMDSWHRPFDGWSAYQPYHVHYFSKGSLALALTRSGFRLAKFSTHESLTGWTNTLVHSLSTDSTNRQSHSAHQKGAGARPVLEAARFALGLALWPVRSLQSVLGHGEELNALAERAV
jgi:2-polyprenyl-3-methyl-5-hydroxy-6-metoxy-1,4-benzoquinol methylase